MLVSPSGVFIRVPSRKQLHAVREGIEDVVEEEVEVTVCADELRPAKHNPNATPAHSFQPAI